MAQGKPESISEKQKHLVQWVIAGATAVASVIALIALSRSCGVGLDPLRPDRRAELAERLRFAAIDGTISVAERQAIDTWLGNDAARTAAKDFQGEIEKSVIAAALATAEGVVLNGKQQSQKARDKFHEALRHDPDFVEAALSLGTAELDANEFDAATRRLEATLTKIGMASPAELRATDGFERHLDAARFRQRFFAHYNLAGCYAGRRPADLDTALGHLEAALGAYRTWQQPAYPTSMILKDLAMSAHFQSLAGHSRFDAVVRGFRALPGAPR